MKQTFLLLFIITILIFITSCKRKNKIEDVVEKTVLTEESATAFAQQLVTSIEGFNSNATFLNDAFDKAYIKSIISNNSIVYSSLDTDFGQQFFNSAFTFGDEALSAVENGGDFRFVHYYKESDEHHLIMHLYRDFSLKIFDFVLDIVDHQIKIKDGFLYDFSTSYSNYVLYHVLYNVLQKTNPEGATSTFIEVNQLLENNKPQEAQNLLDTNQELLQEYPLFQQYKIQSSFNADPKNHISFLEQWGRENLDPRTLLLNKLHYYCYMGEVAMLQNTINQLIDYTGDAPIYLLFFGKACFIAKDYENALYCYENAATGMPLIWDLWFGQLECYHQLKMTKEFEETLLLGKELYGMSDEELQKVVKNYF